jgi:hypothetical protein
MYSSVEKAGGMFYVRLKPGARGNGPIKKFTHGRVTFDSKAKTIQFSDSTPLALPEFDEIVAEGAVIPFGLMTEDGEAKTQRRDVVVWKNDVGLLYMPGIPKTPSVRSEKDNWRTRVYKFRAYFTHPGVKTEAGPDAHSAVLPQWLKDSIERQRRYRNRLVMLCDEARYACRPVDYEAFMGFLRGTVLPAVDEFNEGCDRANPKSKIKADKLRRDTPSIFHLTRFGSFLQFLEKEGKPVPEGLAKLIFDFTSGLKIDFTPINNFHRNLSKIFEQERYLESVSVVQEMDEERNVRERKIYTRLTDPKEIKARAAELKLRDWEWKPVATGFETTLKNRKTRGMSFFEGWPRFSESGSDKWGIHYYLNGAYDAANLLTKGVRGLKLGPAVPPEKSGHNWGPDSLDRLKALHPAEILFHDQLSGEQYKFRFAVLRHEFPWPDGSVIKEWKLINERDGLWLCLVIQGKFAKPILTSGGLGAVHIGWRKQGPEIQPALIYDSTAEGRSAFQRVIVDETLGPERTDDRTPFRINMGASKWGRSSLYWVKPKQQESDKCRRLEAHSPDSARIQDTWYGLELLGQWRDGAKDRFKSLLLSKLESAPQGLQNVGVRTLHQIGAGLIEPELSKAYKAWAEEDSLIHGLTARLSARVAARLKNGYIQVAHDICKHFVSRGITTIVIQNSPVAKASKKKRRKGNDAEQAILDRSQKNRQRVAPALLLQKLVNVAETYGLGIVRVDNADIARTHNDRDVECNHINPPSADRVILCEKCLKQYDQDENALRNMVEAAILKSNVDPVDEDAA